LNVGRQFDGDVVQALIGLVKETTAIAGGDPYADERFAAVG